MLEPYVHHNFRLVHGSFRNTEPFDSFLTFTFISSITFTTSMAAFEPQNPSTLSSLSPSSPPPATTAGIVPSPMAYHSMRGISDTKLLQEIKALGESLYQSHSFRHTTNLALPHPSDELPDDGQPRSRRRSITQWRLRPPRQTTTDNHINASESEKKGIWSWKPMRALYHIGMRRLGCLLSVEVIAVRGLPETMTGLRLSVSVRKKETKDGALRTLPSRISQGSANFEETLFLRCHVYYTGGGDVSTKPLKFEPRLFVISITAVDAPELNFGRNTVDLSLLVKESLEKVIEGDCICHWQTAFPLSGKATGGELVLKLGFQIVEGKGVGFFNHVRKQLKSSTVSKIPPLSSPPSTVEIKIEDTANSTKILPAAERRISNEVVKEVVHNPVVMTTETINGHKLDDAEETVTKEFLQMLELEDEKEAMYDETKKDGNIDTRVFLSELGKGLGVMVQTRDGGYLASINPLDEEVSRTETPKLAMQISRAFVIRDHEQVSGFNVFENLAGMGSEELGSRLLALAAMDELYDKTAEQIAFEGIASAIISGRNKERASSSAARSIAAVKAMATALTDSRSERVLTGIWNVREDPVLAEEILTVSLQKMEVMVVEALKIQADMSDEEVTFTIPPLVKDDSPLDNVALLEDWAGMDARVTLLVIVRLRDPVRRNEAVGAPVIALVQAERVDEPRDDGEAGFKVSSLHMGGLKLSSGAKGSAWDSEKQRLTAMQWLVANGLGKSGMKKKKKTLQAKTAQDTLWSVSSRVVENMWLNAIRNPDVKMS